MDQVRLGVIGCGGMANSHMRVFKDVPRLKFTAASDTFPDNLDKVVKEYGVQGFTDANAMLDSGLIDAVLIATPHYFHPVYSIAAMERGLHVLTEKPVSVTAKAAQEVMDVHAKHPELKYSVMYQLRTIPKWRKAKEIIDSGMLGEIRRVHWTITTWFRTQAYYDSGSWRATWKGEGGGVLLNQCPHNLDLLYWLLGAPKRVTANIALGKYHKIEVEDDVTAFLEYPNGATGVFITSTGEHPGTDFMEIVGDRGKMILSGKTEIEVYQTEVPISEFTYKSTVRMGGLESSKITFECATGGSHVLIHRNFVDAILDGVPLIAPADEGIHSVEMANAIIMSGLTGKPVNVPSDREGYEKLLNELIQKSDAAKKK